MSLDLLGNIDVAEGRLDEARARFREGLTTSQLMADPIGLLIGLFNFGCLAVAEHRPERALHLLGAASARTNSGEFGFIRQRPGPKRAMQAAYAMLEEAVAAEVFSAAATLTLEPAVNEARGMTRENRIVRQGSPPQPRRPRPGSAGGL